MSQSLTEDLSAQVANLFGGRIRVRTCGLLRQNDKLLLVRHRGLSQSGTFWSPPGGGIEFGETALTALKREFLEETGLLVEVGRLLFVNEYVAAPLHAIELFFEVRQSGGALRIGADPEMGTSQQVITDVGFMTFGDIKALPTTDVHTLFGRCNSLDGLFGLTGYFDQL